MPYGKYKEGDQTCVYKHDADGKKMGDAMGCHDTEKEADAQIAALHANVKEQIAALQADLPPEPPAKPVKRRAAKPTAEPVQEFGGSLDDTIQRARMAFEKQYNPPGVSYDMGCWVSDVFADHVVARMGDLYYSVPMTMTAEKVEFAPRDQWQSVQLVYSPVSEQGGGDPEEEIVKESVSVTVFGEFRRGFPEVPSAAGVDMAALTEGDDNPMFLTVPVSRVGEVSKNGLEHTEEFAESLVAQINRDRPGGLMGHIKDEDRATAHPVSDVHWIGATLVDGTVWAKGYIPRTRPEVREDYRIAKAKGAKVATSPYGRAVKEFATQNGKRTWKATGFELEQIDLAPFKRAARPGSGEFAITHEMTEGESPAVQEPAHQTISESEEDVDKAQVIAELTVAEVPQPVREAIIKEYEAASQTAKTVAELTADRDAKGVKVAELETQITAKDAVIAEFEQAKFNTWLDGQVAEFTAWDPTTDEGKKALAGLRNAFRVAVVVKLNGERTPEKVAEIMKAEWEGSYQVLAETIRKGLSGPAAMVGGKARSGLPAVDDSPEAGAKAQAKTGIGLG